MQAINQMIFTQIMAIQLLLSIPGAIIAIIVYEYTKAIVNHNIATELTAEAGIKPRKFRVSPFRFVDPLGLILMVVFGYGWGRPAKLNPFAYRNRKMGFLMVFAMPFCVSLIVGVAFAMSAMLVDTTNVGGQYLRFALSSTARMNIGFAFFNFLPIYPLNGNLLVGTIRPMLGMKIARHERALQVGLVLFIVLGGARLVFDNIVFALFGTLLF